MVFKRYPLADAYLGALADAFDNPLVAYCGALVDPPELVELLGDVTGKFVAPPIIPA